MGIIINDRQRLVRSTHRAELTKQLEAIQDSAFQQPQKVTVDGLTYEGNGLLVGQEREWIVTGASKQAKQATPPPAKSAAPAPSANGQATAPAKAAKKATPAKKAAKKGRK